MSDLHHWIKQVRVHMGLSQEKFGELFAKTKGNVISRLNDLINATL